MQEQITIKCSIKGWILIMILLTSTCSLKRIPAIRWILQTQTTECFGKHMGEKSFSDNRKYRTRIPRWKNTNMVGPSIDWCSRLLPVKNLLGKSRRKESERVPSRSLRLKKQSSRCSWIKEVFQRNQRVLRERARVREERTDPEYRQVPLDPLS